MPYNAYRRSEIAPLFDLPYSERYWGQGFVRQGNQTFLFVTLDKAENAENFEYRDHFLSADASSGRVRIARPSKARPADRFRITAPAVLPCTFS